MPTSANTTRILINSVSYQKKDSNKSKGFGMLFKILPRCPTHASPLGRMTDPSCRHKRLLQA